MVCRRRRETARLAALADDEMGLQSLATAAVIGREGFMGS
jgi:hypothetical protein